MEKQFTSGLHLCSYTDILTFQSNKQSQTQQKRKSSPFGGPGDFPKASNVKEPGFPKYQDNWGGNKHPSLFRHLQPEKFRYPQTFILQMSVSSLLVTSLNGFIKEICPQKPLKVKVKHNKQVCACLGLPPAPAESSDPSNWWCFPASRLQDMGQSSQGPKSFSL